jgi:hypothetical protein
MKELKQLQDKARKELKEDKIYEFSFDCYPNGDIAYDLIADEISEYQDTLIEQTYKQGREDVVEEIEKIREIGNKILGYLEPNNVSSLVYYTPAQSLRNQADYLEQKENDIRKFKELLSELNNK